MQAQNNEIPVGQSSNLSPRSHSLILWLLSLWDSQLCRGGGLRSHYSCVVEPGFCSHFLRPFPFFLTFFFFVISALLESWLAPQGWICHIYRNPQCHYGVIPKSFSLVAIRTLSTKKALQCVGSCLWDKSFCPIVIRQSSSLLLKHD